MLCNTVQGGCKGQQTPSALSLPFIKGMACHMLLCGTKKKKKLTLTALYLMCWCCTSWSRFRRYFSSDMSNPASRPLLREKWKRNDWNDWMWLYGGCLGSRALYHRLQVHILRCYFRFSLVLLWFWIHDGFFFIYGGRCQGGFLFCSRPRPNNAVLCVEIHWAPQPNAFHKINVSNTTLMLESKGSCNFNTLLLFFPPHKNSYFTVQWWL